MQSATFVGTPSVDPNAAKTSLVYHRFTVEQYRAMGKTGILTEDDRVELIEGEIVDMPPIGNEHNGPTNAANMSFTRHPALKDMIVQVQGSIFIPPDSEPEPDVAVLRFKPDYYRSALAQPDDILLLLEIAVTSANRDLVVKRRLYAKAGIPEYRAGDVGKRRIIARSDPIDGEYRQEREFKSGETIVSATIPGLTIAVDFLLG